MINTTKIISITEIIKDRLSILKPSILYIEDFSDDHKNHNQAANSGHYKITISSHEFNGLSKVNQHRLVYKYLNDLIPSPIHAIILNIKNDK
ncbi:BolA protein [Candidatus Kinetoplastibacterium desouzaii TCC079E]|uniref:BolA protein n=1 Tax=Candidatus Kinetoplastidibacterium desouzai TCC079E TaxID=1208919 RepID=M1M473_9PROT|nr:BolA family protein [Candidatus Kinetoplastibacterium desouzaii]AGF47030.1 BolA protein [Candidatus Kinetoplastibacterium desouzaii TCC079E]